MSQATREDAERLATLGEIFSLTFLKEVPETEALSRLGTLPDTLRPRTFQETFDDHHCFEAGYPNHTFVLNLGSWTALLEPDGWDGSLPQTLTALSRGTEAVSVNRHDYACDGFRYAVDGTLVIAFDPMWPQRRAGSDPDRLLKQMRATSRPCCWPA
ncbi:DUF6461 domain-containing protein [Actinomadura napierensis]|uniref:SMI1/KNR4 family protein n=1 Tax=Actinomadura napierensis TaxID=267854 RepID=A0ABP5LDU9_9ACTN